MQDLPQHLKKYIVDQNYSKYTALDHAVWRYILRQLKSFLSENAHESYLDGLKKTGIDIEQIPHIENISAHLEKFGWKALPVSGFIPPAAFMELQSLSILPIASDMRSLDHLLYTPAPDIVHEAAGHAPIIANLEYAEYLRQYAQVAKKAIISREDLALYEAIRELSDLKENSSSTPDQISAAENKLNKISKSISFVSEASELSRMNWWTAEYGLIGPLENPKIFGAGLLSSVGESKWCLSAEVKKIPLSIDCIQQSYDITEPQPQLYVARSFKHLSQVLVEFADTMAFKTGGTKALNCAQKAGSVNTVEFENALQISGMLKSYLTGSDEKVCYVQFAGPVQLCFEGTEINGHGSDYHSQGYGTPVGDILNFKLTDLKIDETVTLNYMSGVQVQGKLIKITHFKNKAAILSFAEATCSYGNEKLFLPEWGIYDIVLAKNVTSVYGGPADRAAYGEIDDFSAARVPQTLYSPEKQELFSFYQKVRDLRDSAAVTADRLQFLFKEFSLKAPSEWLLFVELLEMAVKSGTDDGAIEAHLKKLGLENKHSRSVIDEGLKLAHAKF